MFEENITVYHKNNLRTIWAWNWKKKNIEPQIKITGSNKEKKSVVARHTQMSPQCSTTETWQIPYEFQGIWSTYTNVSTVFHNCQV